MRVIQLAGVKSKDAGNDLAADGFSSYGNLKVGGPDGNAASTWDLLKGRGPAGLLVDGGSGKLPGNYICGENSSVVGYIPFPFGVTEGFARVAFLRPTYGANLLRLSFNPPGSVNDHVQAEINASTGRVHLDAGGTNDRDISTDAWPQSDTEWGTVWIKFLIHASAGYFIAYKSLDDIKADNRMAQWSGDTLRGSLDAWVDSLEVELQRTAITDVAINDIQLEYSAGTGTLPSVGDTITQAVTGDTGVVTAITGTSAGFIQLVNVTKGGVAWDGIRAVISGSGTDPFASSNTITGPGTFSATSKGLTSESGWPKDGVIGSGLVPNSDDAVAMSPSSGVINYDMVDDGLGTAADANYIEDTTGGLADTFGLDTSSVATALEADGVNTLDTTVRGQYTGGGITNLAVDQIVGTSQHAESFGLGSSWGLHSTVSEGKISLADLATLQIKVTTS